MSWNLEAKDVPGEDAIGELIDAFARLHPEAGPPLQKQFDAAIEAAAAALKVVEPDPLAKVTVSLSGHVGEGNSLVKSSLVVQVHQSG